MNVIETQSRAKFSWAYGADDPRRTAGPSTPPADEVLADPASEFQDGEAVVLIPLIIEKHRSVRANISIDLGLLEALDEAAERHGLTRSGFIASAVLDKLQAGG
jgi:hypothetical protein